MRLFLISLLIINVGYSETMLLPQSFTAKFSQMITNPKNKVIKYDGRIQFSDKSILKWSYQNPTQKEVCVWGHELTIVDHDLEQVSYMSIDKEFDFIGILKNAKFHHEDVYVSKYKETSYTIKVDKQKHIQSVAFFDSLDNKVQIVFKQVKYAKGSIPKENIVCAVPENFDVIR